MYCNNCGNDVAEGLAYCDACGAEMNADTYADDVLDITPATDPGKTLGIISLILGIASFVIGALCSCTCACLGGILPFLCAVGSIVFVSGRMIDHYVILLKRRAIFVKWHIAF